MSLEEQIALGALILLALSLVLLRRFFRSRKSSQHPAPEAKPLKNAVIVDGSNVMHWKGGSPDLATVRLVVDQLTGKGFAPGVVFDANAGYLLTGKYQHDGALGRALGLHEDRVMVVPKGTPADPAILTAARDMKARVVTNDRFRDWADDFPEIRTPGHLISGSIKGRQVYLRFSPSTGKKKSRKKR